MTRIVIVIEPLSASNLNGLWSSESLAEVVVEDAGAATQKDEDGEDDPGDSPR